MGLAVERRKFVGRDEIDARGGLYSHGMPVLPFKGTVIHVDSGHANASDSNEGTDPNRPLATIDAAVAKCTANNGDVILVSEGHAETINTASAIDLDMAGITVLGLGQGEDRPTITVGSSLDTATVEIGAADVRIANLIFQPGNDGVDILLDINADGAIVEDCEFRSDETNAYQADTYIDVAGGANGADRCTIRRCKIVSITAGAAQAINIGAVEDALVIEDCWIDGDFTAAGILSGSIFTNALIRRNVVSNRAAGVHAVEFTAACTGLFVDNRMYGDTLGTILDPGSLKCLGNLETDAVDQAGVDSPRTSAGGFPNDSITAAAIATDAIDADAMADGAITAATFAAGAIDATAIAAGAIDAATFAAGAIDAAAIGVGAIAADAFAAGAIDAAAIANGAIDAATFAAGAIDAAAIAAGAIDAATFAAGAIDAAAIAAAAIDAATFAADALQAMQDEAEDALEGENLDHLAALTTVAADMTAEVVDGSVLSRMLSKTSDTSSYDPTTDALEMASDKLGAFSGDGGAAQDDSAKASLDLLHTDIDAILADTGTDGVVIAAGAIVAATFGAGAIDAAAIGVGAIAADAFAAGAIDAAAIGVGAIAADAFAAGAIDAAAIAAGAVDADAIAADAITNAKIADGALATEQFALSVGEKTTDGVVVTRATGALPQSTSADIFTVTGLVLLKRIVGYVTVQIGAFANATKLKVNSTGAGATTDISGTVELNAAVVDTRLEITGTFANAMVATIDLPLAKVQVTELVIPPGTIMVDCAGSDGGGGRVRWSATYVPLESGAQIVAA